MGDSVTIFFITLQNVGANPLTVIKGVPNDQLVYVSEVGEKNQWNHRLIYRWELGEIRDGVSDIPSEADLKLVKLQKGEATQFRIVQYTDEKIERDRFRFEYSLGEKLAARFGTWSGRLEANLEK